MGERIDRLIDSVNSTSDAFLDAMRSGNERAYRFSKIVIEEAGRTQREQADLAKQFLEAPLDPIGLTKSTMDTVVRRQRRRMELGRTLVSDLAEIRDETRDVVVRVVEANREAVVVGAAAGRDAARETAARASDVADRVSDVATRAGHEVSERLEDASKALDEAPTRGRSNARKRNGR
jgi:malonyl CoA-acyl carrier protein transacylase